jgi:hypothetical protein
MGTHTFFHSRILLKQAYAIAPALRRVESRRPPKNLLDDAFEGNDVLYCSVVWPAGSIQEYDFVHLSESERTIRDVLQHRFQHSVNVNRLEMDVQVIVNTTPERTRECEVFYRRHEVSLALEDTGK